MLPIFLISIIGLITSEWGTQFYITCIEAIIFLFIYAVLTIIELNIAKMHGYNKIEDDPSSVQSFVVLQSAPPTVDEDIELRRKALKKILNRMLGEEKIYDDHKILS